MSSALKHVKVRKRARGDLGADPARGGLFVALIKYSHAKPKEA
jgi:hypothetical protein